MTQKVVLGVDVGGTNVKTGLVAKDGDIKAAKSWPTESYKGFSSFSKALYRNMKDMTLNAGIDINDVCAAGIGLPGFLDLDKGVLNKAVNLKWEQDVPVKESLTAMLKVPVTIDNDANLAALGEVWLGAGIGSKSALCVTIGTGIGGGIVLDGRIYHGASAMAGEIGHLTMKQDGDLCNCGRYGCLETLASATALSKMAERAGLKSVHENAPVTAKDVFCYIQQGNPVACEVVEQMAAWLARGLAQAATLLNPDTIIIAGGVVQAGDDLFNPLVRSFSNLALQRVSDSCKLVPAKLGTQAGMLGAAKLAWQYESTR